MALEELVVKPEVVAGLDYAKLREYFRRVSEVALDTGRVENAGSNFIQDTSKKWKTDIWTPYLVVEIVEGKGMGQMRLITSNDETKLYVYPDWEETPDKTSRYAIRRMGIEGADVLDRVNRVLGQLTDGTTTVAPKDFSSALRGTGNRDFTTLETDVESIYSHLYDKIDLKTTLLRDSLLSRIAAVNPRNFVQVAGTPLTGRDWSLDFAKLPDILDRVTTARDTLTEIRNQFDLSVTGLRDALRGTANRTLSDLFDRLGYLDYKFASVILSGNIPSGGTYTHSFYPDVDGEQCLVYNVNASIMTQAPGSYVRLYFSVVHNGNMVSFRQLADGVFESLEENNWINLSFREPILVNRVTSSTYTALILNFKNTAIDEVGFGFAINAYKMPRVI